MTVVALHADSEMTRIQALLDRLDPQPRACTVPGCVHDHGGQEHIPAAA
jgi:hypothetical protein